MGGGSILVGGGARETRRAIPIILRCNHGFFSLSGMVDEAQTTRRGTAIPPSVRRRTDAPCGRREHDESIDKQKDLP
jgi:hypothetical protein